MKTMCNWLVVSMAFVCVALVGCGDDDGSGGSGADAAALMDAMANPTGAVTSAEGAQGVTAAFAEKLSAASGGSSSKAGSCSPDQPDVAKTCDCEAGGTETVLAHGDESAYTVDFTFNECCDSADSCCWTGSGWVAGSGSEGAAYSSCNSFDIDLTCPDATNDGSISLASCQDGEGVQWYLVEYEGETYSVSGSYSSGAGGTWIIRDATTTWECTEDAAGAGSCTDGTNTYSWT